MMCELDSPVLPAVQRFGRGRTIDTSCEHLPGPDPFVFGKCDGHAPLVADSHSDTSVNGAAALNWAESPSPGLFGGGDTEVDLDDIPLPIPTPDDGDGGTAAVIEDWGCDQLVQLDGVDQLLSELTQGTSSGTSPPAYKLEGSQPLSHNSLSSLYH